MPPLICPRCVRQLCGGSSMALRVTHRELARTFSSGQSTVVDGTSADVNESSRGLHQLHLSFPDQLVRLRCQAHHHHHKICSLEQAVYLFAVSGTNSLLLLLFPGGEKKKHHAVFQGISHENIFFNDVTGIQTKGSDYPIRVANRWQTKVKLVSAGCLGPSGRLRALQQGMDCMPASRPPQCRVQGLLLKSAGGLRPSTSTDGSTQSVLQDPPWGKRTSQDAVIALTGAVVFTRTHRCELWVCWCSSPRWHPPVSLAFSDEWISKAALWQAAGCPRTFTK